MKKMILVTQSGTKTQKEPSICECKGDANDLNTVHLSYLVMCTFPKTLIEQTSFDHLDAQQVYLMRRRVDWHLPQSCDKHLKTVIINKTHFI